MSADHASPAGPAHIPSLDGIRALSFLLVFAAHAGLDRIVPGGFGVTVFFFLSGFLITGMLTTDLSSGKFSIVRFYERRIRRIFPALLVTVLATLVFGAAWMNPTAFESLGRCVIAEIESRLSSSYSSISASRRLMHASAPAIWA